MSDSGNLPHNIHSYATLPHVDRSGGILEDLLDEQLAVSAATLAEHGVDLEEPLRARPNVTSLAANGNGDFYPDALDRDIEQDITDRAFLLRSPSGDMEIFPSGITEEDDFIVLFFEKASDLPFRPSNGTNFVGAYDAETERITYDLFYSGILFKLPDSEQLSVIFHKR